MSQRGLTLALQRLHDDPGFIDLVAQDSQSTLGIYDLDETECNTLIEAVNKRDGRTIRKMAEGVGIDWTADHIQGAGALDDTEVSTEASAKPGIHTNAPGAIAGDGYEGVTPGRIPGS